MGQNSIFNFTNQRTEVQSNLMWQIRSFRMLVVETLPQYSHKQASRQTDGQTDIDVDIDMNMYKEIHRTLSLMPNYRTTPFYKQK